MKKAIKHTEKAVAYKAQLEEKRTLQQLNNARKEASKALSKARKALKGKPKLVDLVELVESALVVKRAIATNSHDRPAITLAHYT